MKNLLIIICLLCVSGCSNKKLPPKLVLFAITTESPDKRIERVFLKEQNAWEYVNYYKNSHDYKIEKLKINE